MISHLAKGPQSSTDRRCNVEKPIVRLLRQSVPHGVTSFSFSIDAGLRSAKRASKIPNS